MNKTFFVDVKLIKGWVVKMNFNELVVEDCRGGEYHFKELRKLHRLCMEDKVIGTLLKWDDDVQLVRLQKHYHENGNTLKFVKLNDKVIATFNFHPKKFEDEGVSINFLEQLYISPDYQSMGLGSYLLETYGSNVETRLSVLKGDLASISFYEWQGFKNYKTDEYQSYFVKMPV